MFSREQKYDFKLGRFSLRVNPSFGGVINDLSARNTRINAQAGAAPTAQWVWRLPNGSGIGMPGIDLPTQWESRAPQNTTLSEVIVSGSYCVDRYGNSLEDAEGFPLPAIASPSI